jgi:two-component system LytT family response regulator
MNLPINHSFQKEDRKIALPSKKGLNFYEVKNIIRCRSDNSYTEFFIIDNDQALSEFLKIRVSKGFDHFEEFLLSKGDFYRVHNQHLVNIIHIRKYIRTNGNYLIMDDFASEMIPVARSRKEGFLNYLKMKGVVL